MRTWSLPAGSPLTLRLAADARLCTPDYADDQIWQLNLREGDPPALAVETTYGLRARSMRIFPGFQRPGEVVIDPARFAAPPAVQAFFPNYLRVVCTPFAGLEVAAEYWTPDSHSLAGRFLLTNRTTAPLRTRLSLHALLRPNEPAQPMRELVLGGITVLAGRSGALAPVVFLAGGATAEHAPFPSLTVAVELAPGAARALPWAQSGRDDPQAGFDAARALAARHWDAEIARIELVNAGLVEIETGDPDWDAALAQAQTAALAGYVGPTGYLPHASFVLTRSPDRGHSPRRDGRDHPPAWEGQSPPEAYLSAAVVLPAAPELAKGLVRNFLAARGPDGALDGRPGLGGQRAGRAGIPLVASLAWRIYRHTEDAEFLRACLPGLLESLEAWFAPAHDRDQDGLPEWDHVLHAGFDDWPSFTPWREWGQGFDLTSAETPDLATYLYAEIRSVQRAARAVGRPELAAPLEPRAQDLRRGLQEAWSDEAACFLARDRDTHASPPGERLGGGAGDFTLEVERAFDPPVRIVLRAFAGEAAPAGLRVTIHGRGGRGRYRAERMEGPALSWFWNQGRATSERAYTRIERVEVRGLPQGCTLEVLAGGLRRADVTGLLPLWAGVPDDAQAERLVRGALTDPARFWRARGVPACPADDPAYAPDPRRGCGAVAMFWNTLLVEGLLDYGYIAEAAELVTRLMDGPLESLRADGAFRERYNPDGPGAYGEPDHLGGLAPVHLFLRALGLHLIAPDRLELRGPNPFPWPVRVRWRGLEVLREPGDRTRVVLPDGESLELHGEEPRRIERQRETAGE